MTQTLQVLLSAFAPLPSTQVLQLDANATPSHLLHALAARHRLSSDSLAAHLRVTTADGQTLPPNLRLALAATNHDSVLPAPSTSTLHLALRARVRGGKGGFGSMLRAAGGKMSHKRGGQDENTDSCRDLNGRRLSTVRQAKQLAAYLESAGERQRQMDERQRRKYERLERMLGRKPRGEADFVEAARRMDERGEALDEDEADEGAGRDGGTQGNSSSSSGGGGADPAAQRTGGAAPKRAAPTPTPASASASTKRQRIDDHAYLDQSRDIVEGVRSAVASAMLKKRKRAALASGGATSAGTTKAGSAAAAKKPSTPSAGTAKSTAKATEATGGVKAVAV